MSKDRKKFVALADEALAKTEETAAEELLFTYKGLLYPTTLCSPETFKALESFEARSEDVLLAGYPKSGTNWVGQILTDLVDRSAKDTNNADDDELEEFPYLEVGDAEKYQRMANLPTRRVMFTHLRPSNLPTSIFKKKVKILLLIRNPKDALTSLYHFFSAWPPPHILHTWDEYFKAYMSGQLPWGSYFDYLSEWNEHAEDENVMTITYEELKQDRASGVKRISEFFELNLTEQEIQDVIDKSSFEAMKENADKTHGKFGKILFRKGGVSDWKNLFNEENNQEMDTTFEERLGGTKLGEKLKYGVYCKA